MTPKSLYLVASDRERLVHGGQEYEGRQCQGCSTIHLLYALPLTEHEVEACRVAEWSRQRAERKPGKKVQRGRKSFASAEGVPLFVSSAPNCSWPGTKLKPRTDSGERGAGPCALTARERSAIAAAADVFAPLRTPSRRSQVMGAMGPLEEAHRRELVRWIALFAAVPSADPVRRVADDMLSRLLRRWTADSAERSAPHRVKLAGRIHDFDTLPHTPLAKAATKSERVHEHAVPCNVLLEWICREPRTEKEIRDVLEEFCLAAIVHVDEDRLLNKKHQRRMPATWELVPGADPWARYQEGNDELGAPLYRRLIFPGGRTP